MTRNIDLNCDMGEGFGRWSLGFDREMLSIVSSANIACGFHAGDPGTMRATVHMALEAGVSVGAHPSYPDLQGFGRREMALSADEVRDIVVYQVGAMMGICASLGGALSHVKPHGALYNRAAVDRETARAVASAVKSVDGNLTLYGLSESLIIEEGEKAGLSCRSEVFADRSYQADGTLTPRSTAGALITDPETSLAQVLQMVSDQSVTALSGEAVPLRAETVCVHGDADNAVSLAREIRRTLEQQGFEIASR